MTSFAGAVILPELQKTLLFKNRDMNTEHQKDTLFYDVDCFGVKGINVVTGDVSGLAIGVNRYGLTVANTHVRNTDNPSYHELTEQILMFAKDAEDGLSMVEDHLKSGRKYQWGNLILADLDSVLAIEIALDDYSVETSKRKVLRSSHHIMLDTETMYDTSVRRVERGYELIKNVDNVKDIFELLKDHGEQKGQSSICMHPEKDGDAKTVMSYVVEIDHVSETGKPKMVFHVAKGSPCETIYTSIPLIFPADEEISKRAFDMYP
ncbi:MAG: C45 family peptidase [Candidatus Thorarchaeota archaeon]|nr:C45 family peptidase [Candidatus Thorarchaeota archaeon]